MLWRSLNKVTQRLIFFIYSYQNRKYAAHMYYVPDEGTKKTIKGDNLNENNKKGFHAACNYV